MNLGDDAESGTRLLLPMLRIFPNPLFSTFGNSDCAVAAQLRSRDYIPNLRIFAYHRNFDVRTGGWPAVHDIRIRLLVKTFAHAQQHQRICNFVALFRGRTEFVCGLFCLAGKLRFYRYSGRRCR